MSYIKYVNNFINSLSKQLDKIEKQKQAVEKCLNLLSEYDESKSNIHIIKTESLENGQEYVENEIVLKEVVAEDTQHRKSRKTRKQKSKIKQRQRKLSVASINENPLKYETLDVLSLALSSTDENNSDHERKKSIKLETPFTTNDGYEPLNLSTNVLKVETSEENNSLIQNSKHIHYTLQEEVKCVEEWEKENSLPEALPKLERHQAADALIKLEQNIIPPTKKNSEDDSGNNKKRKMESKDSDEPASKMKNTEKNMDPFDLIKYAIYSEPPSTKKEETTDQSFRITTLKNLDVNIRIDVIKQIVFTITETTENTVLQAIADHCERFTNFGAKYLQNSSGPYDPNPHSTQFNSQCTYEPLLHYYQTVRCQIIQKLIFVITEHKIKNKALRNIFKNSGPTTSNFLNSNIFSVAVMNVFKNIILQFINSSPTYFNFEIHIDKSQYNSYITQAQNLLLQYINDTFSIINKIQQTELHCQRKKLNRLLRNHAKKEKGST